MSIIDVAVSASNSAMESAKGPSFLDNLMKAGQSVFDTGLSTFNTAFPVWVNSQLKTQSAKNLDQSTLQGAYGMQNSAGSQPVVAGMLPGTIVLVAVGAAAVVGIWAIARK